MKLAIMQPYFFPYIGYYQLIAAVDKFVLYDDVNFIKNGWINRNRLILAGEVRYITIPLSGASSFLKINEIDVQVGDGWRRKLAENLRHSYSKAPYFTEVNALFQEVLFSNENRIGEIAKESLTSVCKYLGIETEFVHSSTMYGNSSLGGKERVLDICARENAHEYHNLPGGRELYHEEEFVRRGVELDFIQPHMEPYSQFSEKFQPGLSIVDVLMFNSREAAKKMIEPSTAR